MNEFNKVEQSHRRKGLPSLFSDILHIELLLGPPEEEVYEIINSLGSGRKKAELIRNVPSSSLIAVENDPENFCLFLAIALTVRYRQIQETENKHFRRTLQKGFERLTSQGGFYNYQVMKLRKKLHTLLHISRKFPLLAVQRQN